VRGKIIISWLKLQMIGCINTKEKLRKNASCYKSLLKADFNVDFKNGSNDNDKKLGKSVGGNYDS
jgi:hypothetical protein